MVIRNISYKGRDEKNCRIGGGTAWHVLSLPRKVICNHVVLDGLESTRHGWPCFCFLLLLLYCLLWLNCMWHGVVAVVAAVVLVTLLVLRMDCA